MANPCLQLNYHHGSLGALNTNIDNHFFNLNFCSRGELEDYNNNLPYNDSFYGYYGQNFFDELEARFGVSMLPYYLEPFVKDSFFKVPNCRFYYYKNYTNYPTNFSYYDYLLYTSPFFKDYDSKLCIVKDSYERLLYFDKFKRIIFLCNWALDSLRFVYFLDRFFSRVDVFHNDCIYRPSLHRFQFSDNNNHWIVVDEADLDSYLIQNDIVLVLTAYYDCFNGQLYEDDYVRGVYFNFVDYESCICKKLFSLDSLLKESL